MKMRNIFYALCMTFLMVLVLIPAVRTEATTVDFDDYGGTYAYEALAGCSNGTDRQALYNDIYALAKDFWSSQTDLADVTSYGEYVIGTIDISEYTLTETDVIETFFSFKNDHPIFYYISNTVWVNENGVVITADEDYKNASYRDMYNTQVLSCVEVYKSEVNSLTTDYEKVVAIHDKIVNLTEYVFDEDGKPSTEAYAHNILGVFNQNRGVCESYARTFQLVMNVLDIENYIITGVSNDENHAWNMVKLDDNKYYYVDCTWDDTTSSNNYLAKGSYVFDISHEKNTSEGTGTMYLYDLPIASEDSYLKTFTLSCNGTDLGRFASMEIAFTKMTNKTGKYVVSIDAGATVYMPAGQWPQVAEIRIEGGSGYCYVQLLGDSTANSDLVISEMDFDTQMTYIQKNNKLAILNIGSNSFTTEQDVRFGGYTLFMEDTQISGPGVNIKGNTGSSFNIISEGQEGICDIKNDYINVDKINIKDSDFHIYGSNITANKIILDGSIRVFSMFGDTKGATINTKATEIPDSTGFITTQCMAPGCSISLGNVTGNGNMLALTVVCADKEVYPSISLTNSTVRINFNLVNSTTTLNGFGATHYVWKDAAGYKEPIFNIGNANVDMLNSVNYNIGKLNSNNELEEYTMPDIKGLFVKDSKGNVYRKYDEYFDIQNGLIRDYVFIDKCTVEKLVIPSNVRTIGSWAFGQCYSIKSVTIPSNVNVIQDSAFVNSPNLKTVTIPSTVINIGTNAFGYNYNIDTQEFTKVQGFTIICEKGSVAELYAIDNGINYVTIPTKINKFKVSEKTANSITLKWNKDNSASGYIIKQYKNGKWVNIKTITKKNTTTYKVTGLSASKSYKFRIVAYNKVGNTYVYSKVASSITGTTNPKAVTKLKAAKRTKNSIKLSWARNKNVNGYVIEMKKGKKWVKVKTLTKNSKITYTKTKLSRKTTYSFRIKTYKKIGKTTYYSAYKTIKVKTK